MRNARAIQTAILVLAACSASGENERTIDSNTLRASTHAGLDPLTPDVWSSATTNLSNLVYPMASEFVESRSVNGAEVTLRLKRGSPIDAATLSRALHAPNLVSTRATSADTVVATFTDPERALLMTPSFMRVAIEGDYAVSAFEQDRRLVLRRKSAGLGFGEIEFRNFPSQAEEWHHFLGGQVDLVADVSSGEQHYLREDPTVKVIPFSEPVTPALLFRVDSPTVSRVEVRRALSLALRRRAIATMATGKPDAAISAEENVAEAAKLLAAAGYHEANPMKLRVLVPAQASDFQRAGLVIEQQLAYVHVDVDFIVADAKELGGRLQRGDFDALLRQAGFEPRYWHHFVTGNFTTGYSNAEFDRAYADGDYARGREILAADLPATPLYRTDQAVAVDARLCGVAPTTVADLSWLARVHACPAGGAD